MLKEFETAPHVVPYQGSKRQLGKKIGYLFPEYVDTLYEPFAGSAAISLFAAKNGLAKRFVINDVYEPLIQLWNLIVNHPQDVGRGYKEIWDQQAHEDDDYFFRVRSQFNVDKDPVKFLYLVTRCVKNAVRFSASGNFTQSHDRRRLGTRPEKMLHNIEEVSQLLKGKVEFLSVDYDQAIASARPVDLIYMDPPYQGTSEGADKRYFQSLDRDRVVATLVNLNHKGIPFILSYDGICGTKTYGDPLPEELQLNRLLLDAGKSTQATLNGQDEQTFESVYTPYYIQFTRTPSDIVPDDIRMLCDRITKKRPKGVVESILTKGFVTRTQIEAQLDQAHAARAAQDVKDEGIPLQNFKFRYPNSTQDSYYVFGLDSLRDYDKLGGRKPIAKSFRREMFQFYGPIHAFTHEPFPESLLSVDHRVPYAILGDNKIHKVYDFMLIDATYQRRKSFACENCPNWKIKDIKTCGTCYWAFPDAYEHAATFPIRQVGLSWSGSSEIASYEQIKGAAVDSKQPIETFIKNASHIAAITPTQTAVEE